MRRFAARSAGRGADTSAGHSESRSRCVSSGHEPMDSFRILSAKVTRTTRPQAAHSGAGQNAGQRATRCCGMHGPSVASQTHRQACTALWRSCSWAAAAAAAAAGGGVAAADPRAAPPGVPSLRLPAIRPGSFQVPCLGLCCCAAVTGAAAASHPPPTTSSTTERRWGSLAGRGGDAATSKTAAALQHARLDYMPCCTSASLCALLVPPGPHPDLDATAPMGAAHLQPSGRPMRFA